MKEYTIMMYLPNQITWSNNKAFRLVDNFTISWEFCERFL